MTSYQNKVQIEHTEAETTKRRQAQGWEEKLIVCEGDSGHSTARWSWHTGHRLSPSLGPCLPGK